MAAVSLLGSTFTTTAGAKSVTASPAVGDLILIAVMVTGDSTWSAPTDNNSSGTYTLIDSYATGGASIPDCAWYVRDALISSATSTIFTLANPGSDDGGGLAVIKVTGMSKFGSDAVRQSKKASSGGSPPATGTWTSAKLTTNPVVGLVTAPLNPPAVTPTTSYSELLDTGYNTPTSGIEIQYIDSGDTTNTMTWGSSIATGWRCIGVELDASASASTGNMFLMF